MRLSLVLVVISGALLAACGGGSDSDGPEVSEQEASTLVAKREVAKSECVRSEGKSLQLTCNVTVPEAEGNIAVVEIRVSESGKSFVVEDCEQLGGGAGAPRSQKEQLEQELGLVPTDPCKSIH